MIAEYIYLSLLLTKKTLDNIDKLELNTKRKSQCEHVMNICTLSLRIICYLCWRLFERLCQPPNNNVLPQINHYNGRRETRDDFNCDDILTKGFDNYTDIIMTGWSPFFCTLSSAVSHVRLYHSLFSSTLLILAIGARISASIKTLTSLASVVHNRHTIAIIGFKMVKCVFDVKKSHLLVVQQ